MRARVRGKVTYYFYDQRPKKPAEIALGKVYAVAVKKWAELEANDHDMPSIITLRHVIERYQREVIPTKAERTQVDNGHEIAKLLEFFDDPPAALADIKPVMVGEYMDWRTDIGKTAKTRANREKALLSHVWNKARSWGYTDAANPCKGVEGYTETGREVYIEDDVFAAVYDKADQPLKDAMDLAYLTGQRVADTRAFDEMHVRDGFIHVRQGKTNVKRRIAVVGELKNVLARIAKRKRGCEVHHTRLIVDEDGRPLQKDQMRYRFDKAREKAGIAKIDFQFRDLRAKAGTDKAEDSGDIRQAQKQLGHASVTMTEKYVRNRRGDKSTPTVLRKSSGIAENGRKPKTP
jgi:integrase